MSDMVLELVLMGRLGQKCATGAFAARWPPIADCPGIQRGVARRQSPSSERAQFEVVEQHEVCARRGFGEQGQLVELECGQVREELLRCVQHQGLCVVIDQRQRPP